MLAIAAFPASGATSSLEVQMVFWRLARKALSALGASSACIGARCRLMPAHTICVADRPHQQAHLNRGSKQNTKWSHASHSDKCMHARLLNHKLHSATTGRGHFMQSSSTLQQQGEGEGAHSGHVNHRVGHSSCLQSVGGLVLLCAQQDIGVCRSSATAPAIAHCRDNTAPRYLARHLQAEPA